MTLPQAKLPRRFLLVRAIDETGISGTGTVARGLEFPNGYCLMQWIVPPAQSMAIYTSAADLITIHGHNGKTVMDYLSPDDYTGADFESVGAITESMVVALHGMAKLALTA